MTKRKKAWFFIRLSVFIFVAFEFSSCLYRAMPYESRMEEREFTVGSVENFEHIFAINEKGDRNRYYIRRQDVPEIFEQLDASLENTPVKIKYASSASVFNEIVRNNRMCSLQIGDSTYFDIIMPN